MVTYSSLPESGSLKTGSLAPWRKQTITPTTRGSADDSAERGVSTATAGANATTAPAARRRSIARARARDTAAVPGTRANLSSDRGKSKQAQASRNTQAGKQRYRQANLRKGQLNRHARESARSARSAPRPPHLSTRNTDWPLRSRRALNLLAVKRDTQGQTTFLVHDTTTRAVTHGARVGSPRDTACFEFRVGGFSLQTEVRSTQAMLRYTRLRRVENTGSHPGRALSMARCILRFLFLPY